MPQRNVWVAIADRALDEQIVISRKLHRERIRVEFLRMRLEQANEKMAYLEVLANRNLDGHDARAVETNAQLAKAGRRINKLCKRVMVWRRRAEIAETRLRSHATRA